MSNNYSEQIFQSIDTIVSQRLNEVSFDKTEICEIVSQDKDNKNKYWVSNGSLKYEAYSTDENRKYLVNQKVYVTIPSGNYDLRKLIIGSYSADEIPKNLYTNPFNHLVTSSSHIFNDGITLQANSSGMSSSNSKDLSIEFNYSNTTDFDYIGLEFGLDTTSLQGTYKGTYTIELQLFNETGEQLNTSPIILRNTDLYGNPYGLVPALKFQHLFPFPKEINPITDITKIRVLFVQDGNFEKEGYITLQDIKLYFGYDSETITKDELQLILKKEETLRYTTNTTELERNLYLNWNHFDSFNTPYVFNEHQKPNIFNDYTVYWLHYVDGLGKNNNDLPDDIAWNWETIATNVNFNQAIFLVTNYNTDQYKVIIRYKYKEEDEYSYVVSNGIVFENDDVRAEPGAANGSEDSLRIKLDENDTGVYNIYGLDGRMMDSSYRGPHNIHFEFLDTTPLDRIASINWEFPTFNTMIVTTKEEQDKQEQYNTFNIDTMYKPGAMNNRIWCTVTLVTGEVRRGSLTLQFGEAAAAGSNYAFNIDFIGHRTCMYATGEEDTVEIIATFTKQNGEVMTVPTITWSWANDYDSSITLSSSTGEKITLTYNSSKVPKENYSILQAKINDYAIGGLTTNLTAYLPIPIAKPEYNYISGATRVVYDSNGNTATYSRNPYKLYNLTDEIKDTSWHINSNPEDDNCQLKTQVIRDKDGNIIDEEKTLLPLSYIPQEPPATCVYCMLDGNIVWSQPILIMQNRWEYDLLNEWNGKLNINDQNGYVLAPLLGAGKKEDNAFTGVMMGDLKLADGTVTNTGLYGFKEGSRRFSFNDKGQAYIGTGDYYIDFDSENLTIKAKNFDLNAGNGALIISDSDGIKLGDKISFQPNGTATISGWKIHDNYLGTDWGSTEDVWFISQAGKSAASDFGVKTWMIYSKGHFGVTIDGGIYASKGQIADYTINGAQLIGNSVGMSGTSGQGWAFWAGSSNASSAPFRVGHDGYLHATNAYIEGTITASDGRIGNWSIGLDRLEYYTSSQWTILYPGGVSLYCADGISRSLTLGIGTPSVMNFGVTPTGAMYAASGTIAGWTIDTNRIYKGNTELSSTSGATRIKTDSIEINGGSMNINNIFLINEAGRVSIVKTINGNVKSGYFTYGGTVTDHPYVSALNVGWFGTGSTDGGISFRNSANIDDAGSEIAHIQCNSSRMMMVNHNNSINIEAGDSCGIDASAKGYIRISAGNKNAASNKNPGSVYVVGAAHINLVAGQNHHVYAGANGWNNGNNSQVETAAGTISSRSTKTNIKITNDKFYNDALQLLQNMKLYTYNYKYDLYSNKAQYGFVIDEIENQDKQHHFLDIHEQMAWTRGRYIDFCMDNIPKDDQEVNIVAVKSYNRDAFTKYLLTCTKALYNKILILEKEIKEIKQNEI